MRGGKVSWDSSGLDRGCGWFGTGRPWTNYWFDASWWRIIRFPSFVADRRGIQTRKRYFTFWKHLTLTLSAGRGGWSRENKRNRTFIHAAEVADTDPSPWIMADCVCKTVHKSSESRHGPKGSAWVLWTRKHTDKKSYVKHVAAKGPIVAESPSVWLRTITGLRHKVSKGKLKGFTKILLWEVPTVAVKITKETN